MKAKRAFVKTLEADFVKKFRVVLSPMKAAIRHELDAGRSAHEAVDHVFRRYGIREHLRKLVPDLMLKAAKHGK
jgi:23S rRNA G2445 N2-methylase RlmL